MQSPSVVGTTHRRRYLPPSTLIVSLVPPSLHFENISSFGVLTLLTINTKHSNNRAETNHLLRGVDTRRER